MATKSSSKKSSSSRSASKSSSKQSAATKASKAGAKGQDATKTPKEASKSSKIDHRRPAVMPGDLAGAEYNPARTEEGDRVAQTGMNPRASRAGLLVDLPSLATVEGTGGSEGQQGGQDLGLGDIGIAVVDGSRWTLSLGGKTTRHLTQADAGRLQQQLAQVVQETT